MTIRGASPNLPQLNRIGGAILLGAVGGLLFLFAFPKGSITTLMHDVLHLPGPGAGIALILGPVALLFILLSSELVGRAAGGAILAALSFSLVYLITARILTLPTSEKGMFGSIWFVAALAVCGVAAELLLLLTRKLRAPWRSVLAACSANTALLLFYWTAVFPRTKGWILWDDVPLLLVLNLLGGALAGVVVSALGSRVPRLSGFVSRRESDVWTR